MKFFTNPFMDDTHGKVEVGIRLDPSGTAWLAANGHAVVGITTKGRMVRAVDYFDTLTDMGFDIDPSGCIVEDTSE